MGKRARPRAVAQLRIVCAWGLQKSHHDPRPSRANREAEQIGVVNRPTAERPGVSRPEAQIVRGRSADALARAIPTSGGLSLICRRRPRPELSVNRNR